MPIKTYEEIREEWKKAYSKMTGRYIGDEIATFWLEKMKEREAGVVEAIKTSNLWEAFPNKDNKYIRDGIISLLTSTKE